MKYIYDKYCVYFTLFLNNLKYEEEAFQAFKEYSIEFQRISEDLINARYDFLTEKVSGKKRVVSLSQDILKEDYEPLKEAYLRYNFYYDTILDSRNFEYVSQKLDEWQKKYIEISSKYGNFSEVNFVDKKIYTWG